MKALIKSIFILIVIISVKVNGVEGNRFPDDFIFGAASAAFQIEGAWNVAKKGESIWDRMTHTMPDKIADRSNADVADNSYYMYKNDIDLIQQLGGNAYRISISWPRILPNGFNTYINDEGIQYYNNVINEMLRRNITPFVTIFHWDLPQKLQDLGGWENPNSVNWYVDYARVVFNEFGDRVKFWTTMNEPNVFCIYGYNGHFAPGIERSGVADYICAHNIMLAHAKTYKMYQDTFKQKQKGKVGIVMSISWPLPENPQDPEEVAGTKLSWEFWNSWFLHPIFSSKGDYPKNMKDRIANYSRIQGFSKSRLPEFTAEEIELIKNSADFLGINFYTAIIEKKMTNINVKNTVSFFTDVGMTNSSLVFPNDRCTPWAFSAAIKYINKTFNIPAFWITENGYWDTGDPLDVKRTEYFHLHLKELARLISEGINIHGYFVWSLLDNFEWAAGYTQRYGIYSVDFTNPFRPRSPKFTVEIISYVFKTKTVPWNYWSYGYEVTEI